MNYMNRSIALHELNIDIYLEILTLAHVFYSKGQYWF